MAKKSVYRQPSSRDERAKVYFGMMVIVFEKHCHRYRGFYASPNAIPDPKLSVNLYIWVVAYGEPRNLLGRKRVIILRLEGEVTLPPDRINSSKQYVMPRTCLGRKVNQKKHPRQSNRASH